MINLKLPMQIQCALFILLITFSSCSNVTVVTEDNFEVKELPDGSIVYLNHNSFLEFDQEFDPRMIEIKGEFYFSVVKGKAPFIINTELGEVKVIGTEFSVKTSKEEIEIEVEEGSVELNTKQYKNKVERSENAFYKKGEDGIRKGKAKFKFKIWMENLKIEFKKLGKEIKHSTKDLGKESKKVGKKLKKLKKELKKLKTE